LQLNVSVPVSVPPSTGTLSEKFPLSVLPLTVSVPLNVTETPPPKLQVWPGSSVAVEPDTVAVNVQEPPSAPPVSDTPLPEVEEMVSVICPL
jgi:hypothetical protein